MALLVKKKRNIKYCLLTKLTRIFSRYSNINNQKNYSFSHKTFNYIKEVSFSIKLFIATTMKTDTFETWLI